MIHPLCGFASRADCFSVLSKTLGSDPRGARNREARIGITLEKVSFRSIVEGPSITLSEIIVKLSSILNHLEQLAPLATAEAWDNVGLLLGDRDADVTKIMTCLTLTSDVATEAVVNGAQLVVTHHPLLFKAVQRITTDTVEGRTLWQLARAGIAVYSPHTAWDNAPDGINQLLARMFDLENIQPLRPFSRADLAADSGAGRWGTLPQPMTLVDLARLAARKLPAPSLEFVGDPQRTITRLGIACGSAAEFWKDARGCGCDALLTGETRFHGALEVREAEFPLLLAGHYATERPGMEHLARLLTAALPDAEVWASRVERDPSQVTT